MARFWRRPEGNNFHSVSPVKFINNPDGTQGWSQTLRRVVPEKSKHWDKRKGGRFKHDDVFPCNEGFPGLVRVGPIEGGWPIIFDVILTDGTKGQAAVSPAKIGGTPSWLMRKGNGKEKRVPYEEVAGWSSVSADYRGFEKVLEWLIIHWPTRRR